MAYFKEIKIRKIIKIRGTMEIPKKLLPKILIKEMVRTFV